MAKWLVSVPFAGYINVTDDAEDEESAIDAALDSDDLTLDKAEEWEAMRHIVQGNVCYAPLWKADAKPINDNPSGETE